MFSPRTSSRELNRFSNGGSNSDNKHMNYVSSRKEEFQKKREETMMEGLDGSVGADSDFQTSGLMRYRSAPSSLLANFINGDEDFLPGSSSPEPENVFARFISCDSSCLTSESRDLQSMEAKSSAKEEEEMNKRRSLMSAMMEREAEMVQQSNGRFSAADASQMLYQQTQQNHGSHGSAGDSIDDSPYRMSSLQQMESQIKNSDNGSVSSLIRHSSSPAGFFSRLNVENGGYSMMRGTSRLKNQMRFSIQDSSTTGLMSQISEMGSESMGASSSDDGSFGNSGNGGPCYIPGFPVASWDDSPIENFTGLQLQKELAASARKRVRDINEKVLPRFNSSESQIGETGNHAPPPGLTTSAELAALENILQLQGSVPCKIRAKRGHATHPRSIAERVRRTRISERIRKLQELVPNMDKQTNTADMLDLAVEYIKDLQKEVKTLSDNRTSCTCSKLRTYPSPGV